MAVDGITVEPLFIVKATTDEYVDSESLISPLDGQNKLEDLIKRLMNQGDGVSGSFLG